MWYRVIIVSALSQSKSRERERELDNKVERLLTGLTAHQKGTTAQWYSNKTSLIII